MSGALAIFGGSFNPPHVAHVLAVAWVLACEEVDEVMVVPTFRHPFAKKLASYDARVRMCELAMGWLPNVTVSRVEEELGGESRTLHTVEHLVARYPGRSLRLVMGADILLEADKWYRFDRIQELAPALVLGRVGFRIDGAPAAVLPGVSSTEVRALAAESKWDELRGIVPRAALEFMREARLYEA